MTSVARAQKPVPTNIVYDLKRFPSAYFTPALKLGQEEIMARYRIDYGAKQEPFKRVNPLPASNIPERERRSAKTDAYDRFCRMLDAAATAYAAEPAPAYSLSELPKKVGAVRSLVGECLRAKPDAVADPALKLRSACAELLDCILLWNFAHRPLLTKPDGVGDRAAKLIIASSFMDGNWQRSVLAIYAGLPPEEAIKVWGKYPENSRNDQSYGWLASMVSRCAIEILREWNRAALHLVARRRLADRVERHIRPAPKESSGGDSSVQTLCE